nr:MAG TPA: hypothetical protein [Caudoviricetes sp.]
MFFSISLSLSTGRIRNGRGRRLNVVQSYLHMRNWQPKQGYPLCRLGQL